MDYARCYICAKIIDNNEIVSHLKGCINKKYKLPISLFKDDEITYLVEIKDTKNSEYFLYLLVDDCVELTEFDEYLRDIWFGNEFLDSSFVINNVKYNSDFNSNYYESFTNMNFSIDKIVDRKQVCKYIYGIDQYTNLSIRFIEMYKSFSEEKGIRLIARNIEKEKRCNICNDIAKVHFSDPNKEEGYLCDECMQNIKNNKKRKNTIYKKIYNSPRTGIGDYYGPDDDIMSYRHVDDYFIDDTENKEELVKGIIYGIEDEYIDLKLSEILQKLTIKELHKIRKNIDLQNASKLNKQELTMKISDFIIKNIKNVLAVIDSEDYSAFMYFIENGREVFNTFEKIPDIIESLKERGLLFLINVTENLFTVYIPSDLKKEIIALRKNTDLLKVRKDTNYILDVMETMLFYWGVLEENQFLLNIEKYTKQFDKSILSNIMKEKVYNQEIGVIKKNNFKYYYKYANNPNELIENDTWHNSHYINITKDMMSLSGGNWHGLILSNPYSKWLYELFLQVTDKEDEEEIEKTAFSYVSTLVGSCMNLKPGSGIKDLAKELQMNSDLYKLPFLREIMEKLILYLPNYWKKGNSISGEIHLYKGKYKYWEPKNPPIFS